MGIMYTIIPALSLAGGLLSFLSGGLLAYACRSAATGEPTHSQVIKSLLMPIGVADAIAALFWVRTQFWRLAGFDDYEGECAIWAVSGALSFGWMSLWTCIMAHYLHEALVHARPPSFRSTLTKVVAWGLPPLFEVVTLQTHRYSRCANARNDWYVAPPLLAIAYCRHGIA